MTILSLYHRYSSHLLKQLAAIFFLTCALPALTVAQKKIAILFVNKAGAETLQPGNSYMNAWGETFTVYKFKYYIHNIRFADSAGQYVMVDKAHHLVDAADASSTAIRVNGLTGKRIVSIRFTLGVDSVLNTSGVQTGELDPLKGMFWTWNTGYIYAKLEGKSNMSAMPGNIFSYDVGGYKMGESALREVTLQVTTDGNITIVADILKWFDSRNRITIATNAVCHEPGNLAMQLADNYRNMFHTVPVNE